MRVEYRSLPGLVGYAEALALQEELVSRRVRDEICDTVLFLEHTPVVTRGRGLQWDPLRGGGREGCVRKMPLGPLPAGVEYCESARGGDLTYHGPGQLVIYPICKLGGDGLAPRLDVGAWVRTLEGLVIGGLDKFVGGTVSFERRENAAGIWGGEQKIASVGVSIRSWVSQHGVAINVVNELDVFRAISPCGFSGEVMTRLCDVSPGVDFAGWRERLEACFL
ncbi:lipoyl(octanoyl) transferase LipB [Bdellovibrionota bacterium FG-2]